MASPGIRTRSALHTGTLRLPWHRPQPADGTVERAFAEQYERHHQAIYRYCRSILRHEQDAQDALQATMLKAFSAMQAGTVTGDLRPWLFRVAHNEAISMRRRHHTADAPLEAAREVGANHLDQRVEDRASLARLQADLDDLADRQRTALVLREFSGLGHEEIAQVLGSTTGAVKQTIFEARKALLECEAGRSMTCDDIQRVLSDQDGRTLRSRKLRAHLRECAACTAFSEAMEERPRQLALIAPALPAVLGAGMLANLVGGAHSAGAATSAAGSGAVAATSSVAGSSAAAGTGAAASTIATSAGLKVAALLAAGGIATGGGVAIKEHRASPAAPPRAQTTPAPAAATNAAAGSASNATGSAAADPPSARTTRTGSGTAANTGDASEPDTPSGAPAADPTSTAAQAPGTAGNSGSAPGQTGKATSANAHGKSTSSAAKSKTKPASKTTPKSKSSSAQATSTTKTKPSTGKAPSSTGASATTKPKTPSTGAGSANGSAPSAAAAAPAPAKSDPAAGASTNASSAPDPAQAGAATGSSGRADQAAANAAKPKG